MTHACPGLDALVASNAGKPPPPRSSTYLTGELANWNVTRHDEKFVLKLDSSFVVE
jgi:hypothetical protein